MKYYCKFCKEPFYETKIVDNGIGSFEYWGAVGFHTDTEEVSPCCGEDYWIDIEEDILVDRNRNRIKIEDL